MADPTFQNFWPWVLGTLAAVLLVNGIDDLSPALICCWHILLKGTDPRGKRCPPPTDQRRIAIFVPCWKEAAVIADMVRHNVAQIRYRNYAFFLGVYPNDLETIGVVRQLAAAFPNVHMAVCPRPGPTSKADCLNAIYSLLLRFEKERGAGEYFDTVVLHDAEDLIHPEALSVINWERARNAMVQVPVLPLPTSLRDITHGVYCDDFAEYQTIDMRARQFCGAFVPSNGVGTAFARHILDRLCLERGGTVFDPCSLTEDYEVGVYIHSRGYSQVFAPLRKSEDGYIATREYFPRKVGSAIRQRTRWVTGICLQSWERDGWKGRLGTKYWFWRDRKGLLMNPLSLLTNLLFIAGLCDGVAAQLHNRPWHFAVADDTVLKLCTGTMFLGLLRLGMRMFYTGRLYGAVAAFGTPLRAFHGNLINCFATLRAAGHFASAKLRDEPLVWLKTEHAYPVVEEMAPSLLNLGSALSRSQLVSKSALESLREEVQSDAFLANLMIERGLVPEAAVMKSVSGQAGVPFTAIDVRAVRPQVMRTLPLAVGRRLGVVPYRLENGKLLVAGCKLPATRLHQDLCSYTQLPVEFRLVTRANFEQLQQMLQVR